MKREHSIVFVAPGSKSQGGITAVVQNYKKSQFWRNYNCFEFSSSIDETGFLRKVVYLIFRYPVFIIMLMHRQPAVMSLHTSYGNSFYRKLFYLLLARAFKVRVVLHVHPASFFDFYRDGGAIRKWLIELAFHLSDRVVFLSEEQQRKFNELLAGEKSIVLSNPVEVNAYSVLHDGWKINQRQILYLGWIIPSKGVYDLVDALPQVLEEFSDVKIIFAGNKEVAKLEQYIADRGLAGSAKVVGWVDGIEKIRLLRTSRALILPSYTEGVPNVLLEAMASKLPIITTAVGGIPSILKHQMTSLFVEPGNLDQIADAIKLLVGDDSICTALATSAYKEVVSKYSVEVIGKQLAGIYHDYCSDDDRLGPGYT